MKNFWDVTDRSEDWSYIVRTFTRLTGQNYDSVIIRSQVSGSDLGVTLETIIKTGEAIVMATKAAIALKSIRDKFFQKKKKTEDVGITNKATFKMVIKDLEEERDGEYKKKLGEFSVEITKEFDSKKAGANDVHELENMVDIALDKMSNMLADGVKVVDPQEITPVVGELKPVLGPEYAQNKILSDEVKALLADEVQKKLVARHERMEEELEIKDEDKPLEPETKSKKSVGKEAVEKLKKSVEKGESKKRIESIIKS